MLDRTLKFISESIPLSVEEMETKLASAGLTDTLFQLDGVQRAAEVLGRVCPFIIEIAYRKAYAITQDCAGLATCILQIARKAISHWGVTTIEDVTAQVRQSKVASLDVNFWMVLAYVGPAKLVADSNRESSFGGSTNSGC